MAVRRKRKDIRSLFLSRMAFMSSNPVFVAIDTTDLEYARALAARLKPHVGGIKLGLEFFAAHGPAGLLMNLGVHQAVPVVAG